MGRHGRGEGKCMTCASSCIEDTVTSHTSTHLNEAEVSFPWPSPPIILTGLVLSSHYGQHAHAHHTRRCSFLGWECGMAFGVCIGKRGGNMDKRSNAMPHKPPQRICRVIMPVYHCIFLLTSFPMRRIWPSPILTPPYRLARAVITTSASSRLFLHK